MRRTTRTATACVPTKCVRQFFAARKYQPACKPGSVWRKPNTGLPSVGQKNLRDGHSSGTPVARRLVQSTRMRCVMTRPASAVSRSARPSLFDLAPGGVCPAASVTRSAVRSYRTFSPLPRLAQRTLAGLPRRSCKAAKAGGMFSVALSLGSPPAAVSRHRVIMEPGLSSTGCLACAPLERVSPQRSPAAAARPAGPAT